MGRICIGVALVMALAGAEEDSIRPELGAMPTDIGPTYQEIDGTTYGAKPDERGPIGGGEGYTEIVTAGDYEVGDLDALLDALEEAEAGDVIFVEDGAVIDVSTRVYVDDLVLEIPEGVTLAGNRGEDGAPGALIFSDTFETQPLFEAMGEDVRVTGLRIRGPDPKRRLYHHRRSRADDYGYYSFPVSQGIQTSHSGLRVDNCEMAGWSHAAIALRGGTDHKIHHNYIHHNQRQGLGYGVSHREARSLIEYNLFDANRHSIAASGRPGEAYEARHNVELYVARSFPFDMHGGRDRGDGTDIAGDWVKIHNNQFRATDQLAIGIRGVPQEPSTVTNNWFYHEEPGPEVIRPWPCDEDTNITFEDNAFGSESPAVHEDE